MACVADIRKISRREICVKFVFIVDSFELAFTDQEMDCFETEYIIQRSYLFVRSLL